MSRSPRRRRFLWGAAAIAVVAAALGAVWWTGRGAVRDDQGPAVATGGPSAASPTASPTAAPASAVAEPTAGEVVATDPPSSRNGASVIITNAGWTTDERVEVTGFVTGLVENGGSCKVTLTRAGSVERAEHAATPDATITECGAIDVGGPDLDPGLWQAVLSYRSPTSSLVSAPSTVQVPTR